MNDLPILNAEDISYIKKIGLIFNGAIDREIPYDYRGEIIINGKGCGHNFNVLAIEMFSIARPDGVIYENEKIGILVGHASGFIVTNWEEAKKRGGEYWQGWKDGQLSGYRDGTENGKVEAKIMIEETPPCAQCKWEPCSTQTPDHPCSECIYLANDCFERK